MVKTAIARPVMRGLERLLRLDPGRWHRRALVARRCWRGMPLAQPSANLALIRVVSIAPVVTRPPFRGGPRRGSRPLCTKGRTEEPLRQRLRRPRVPASKGKPRHGVAARGGASGPVAILQGEEDLGAARATLPAAPCSGTVSIRSHYGPKFGRGDSLYESVGRSSAQAWGAS